MYHRDVLTRACRNWLERMRAIAWTGIRNGIALSVILLLLVSPAYADRGDAVRSPTVSVSESEASQPTEELLTSPAPTDFVPPPRTIDDISDLLDQHRDTNKAERQSLRMLADRPPPDSSRHEELVGFYFERANAAGALGRTLQQISDLNQAIQHFDLAVASRSHIREDILLNSLSHAHAYNGNFVRAIELRKKAIEKTPHRALGRRATLLAYYALTGDIENAKRAQSEYLEEERQMRWVGDWKIHKNIMLSHLRWGDGRIKEVSGDYEGAEKLYRKGLDLVDADSGNDDLPLPLYDLATVRALFKAEHRMSLGQVLARQGRLAESELETRRALSILLNKFGKLSPYTADALTRLSEIVREQGRAGDSATLAQLAIKIREQIGSSASGSLYFATARRALARAHAMQRQWSAVTAQFEQIQSDLGPDDQLFQGQFKGDPDWAIALVSTGQPEKALENLRNALDKRQKLLGNEHYDVAEMRGVAAMAEAASGNHRGALDGFLAAVPVLVNQATTVGTGTARATRRALIFEAFLDLLSSLSGTPTETDASISAGALAFWIAEAARGRMVEQALVDSAARAVLSMPGSDPELVRLARMEQDARRQVAAYESLLGATVESGTEGAKLDAIVESLLTRLERARGVKAEILNRIENGYPDYAAIVSPKPATLESIKNALHKNEAFLSFYVGEQKIFVWAVPANGEAVFASVPIGPAELARRVARLRMSLEPDVDTLGEIPPFDTDAAYQLFENLLKPVESGWAHQKHLLVVPHGPLAYLPFSLFPTRPAVEVNDQGVLFSAYRSLNWLIRDYALTQLPSAASLIALRRTRAKSKGRHPFLAFADPVFSDESAESNTTISRGGGILQQHSRTRQMSTATIGHLPRLPETAAEVLTIAKVLGADQNRDLFLRSEATESRLDALNRAGALADYRILSFATHALVPGDLDGLDQPALALSAPKVVGGEGDGFLTMEEILALKLNADWVVLSACNTAAAEGAGAEAVSGLGRAFFYAGTQALLVSNWPVHSRATEALMTGLFSRLANNSSLTRAQALKEAMLTLIDDAVFEDRGEPVFSYAHPLFWAPFTLVGEGGSVL